MTPLHMGDLHPFEQLLVALLAFGPLLLLVAVVIVARRRDAAEEAGQDAATDAAEPRDD